MWVYEFTCTKCHEVFVRSLGPGRRAEGALDEARVTEIDREARRRVAEAVRFAEESPAPPPDDLYRDVYAEEG